jgi:cytochrome P450
VQQTTDGPALNPFPWYAQMRSTDPMHYYAPYNSWQVFRYDDVQRVLSDYASFSSSFGGMEGGDPLSTSLISMYPPRHRQYRNLVT